MVLYRDHFVFDINCCHSVFYNPAVFYNHLEINLKKKFSKISNIVAWIHLLGMNIGGPGSTILMIFASLTGSGVLLLFIEGKLGNQDVGIMNSFIPFIAFFIVVLSIVVICGGGCIFNSIQID
jgi:hypothetical protein